jgi:hydrogenase maturation protease
MEVREIHGDPSALLDVWLGREGVVLVDAMRSGASPGTIRRWDASSGRLPERRYAPASTHAAGLAETIELARALGRLPARLIVYGVEGRRYDAGAGLSHELDAVVPVLVERLLGEVDALRTQ